MIARVICFFVGHFWLYSHDQIPGFKETRRHCKRCRRIDVGTADGWVKIA